MNKVTRFAKGVVKEGKRVRWPDRETMWKSLIVVIVISLIAALWLLLDNLVASALLKSLGEVFKNM